MAAIATQPAWERRARQQHDPPRHRADRRAPGDPLRLRSVSKAVDSRRNSGPDLLAEHAHAPAAGGGPNPA